MNYLLNLSYLGCAYSGFQIQKNAPTIAGALTDAAERLFGDHCKITGCSRTDRGVHARDFYASLKVSDTSPKIPCDRIPDAMNCLLPYDIAIKSARIVPDAFNPRFDTVYKEYEYVVSNKREKDPFAVGRKHHYNRPIDEKLLDRECKAFVGKHDFAAFMATGSDAVTTVREIKYCGVRREGDDVIFTFAADGFLYNMVRIMVGTLLYISEGKIKEGSIGEIIESKDRTKAGITVPPDGLYLTRVVLNI